MFAGISEITSNMSSTSDGKSVKVDCSATGKPAPVFSWNSSAEELSKYVINNFTVENEDGSISTTSQVQLPLTKFHKDEVKCVGQSGSLSRSKIIYWETEEDSGM